MYVCMCVYANIYACIIFEKRETRKEKVSTERNETFRESKT